MCWEGTGRTQNPDLEIWDRFPELRLRRVGARLMKRAACTREECPLQADGTAQREEELIYWLQKSAACALPRTARNQTEGLPQGMMGHNLGSGEVTVHHETICLMFGESGQSGQCCFIWQYLGSGRGVFCSVPTLLKSLYSLLSLLAVTWGQSLRDRAPVCLCVLLGCGGNGFRVLPEGP